MKKINKFSIWFYEDMYTIICSHANTYVSIFRVGIHQVWEELNYTSGVHLSHIPWWGRPDKCKHRTVKLHTSNDFIVEQITRKPQNYPCFSVMSATSILIICRREESLRLLVWWYSLMIQSPPGFCVRASSTTCKEGKPFRTDSTSVAISLNYKGSSASPNMSKYLIVKYMLLSFS